MTRNRLVAIFILALLCMVITPSAHAQPTTEIGASGSNADTVDLKVLQFGAGNLARPGSWIGVQIEVADLTATTREIVLELGMPDVGGDTALYQTTLALGGEKKAVWLYARLPFTIDQSSEFTLNAFASIEASSAQRQVGVARTGSLLKRYKFRFPQSAFISQHDAILGIVGRSLTGLNNYESTVGTGSSWPAVANETLRLTPSLSASTLPDRWMGLSQFDALVWTGSGPDLDPTALADDRVQAIRDWVNRGGHLVIVLPSVGQTWLDVEQPLKDIMPRVKVIRSENTDLNPYRPLFSDNEKLALPTSTVVQHFQPLPTAQAGEATTILQSPDQLPIVVRRNVGAGCVTVIGVDIASRALTSLNTTKADVFWNRILGRRGIYLDGQEIQTEIKSGRVYKNLTDRYPRSFDTDIAPLINKTGHAAAGVLLAFAIFAIYWLLAGPVVYFILKRKQIAQYSWLAFAGLGLLFTGIAWGGASALKPGRVDAQHLTLIDHVYGQDTQRAKVWISALLPSYGSLPIALADAEKHTTPHAAFAPWDAPPTEFQSASANSTFPDARGFGINSRDPDALLLPARSTVKTVTIDWAGGPAWKMPLPVKSDGSAIGATLSASGDVANFKLAGALKHDLPGTLTDVYVIVVRGQREVRANQKINRLLQASMVWQQRAQWKAGEIWDFESEPTVSGWQSSDMLNRLVGRAVDDPYAGYTAPRTRRGQTVVPQADFGKLEDRLVGLSLFGVLDPPDATSNVGRPILARRSEAHGWDIARWFTQPCVIIIGHLKEAECPVPLTLDGDKLGTTGHTVVRWMYPLPDNPPRVSTGN